ncbi:integrase core domain-containing protein [Hirsutella rhossiliensis]
MQNHSFRTPFQLLHQWLRDNNRDIGYQQDQPDITFLKAYGCRAYPLTPQALQNRQKKDLKTDLTQKSVISLDMIPRTFSGSGFRPHQKSEGSEM